MKTLKGLLFTLLFICSTACLAETATFRTTYFSMREKYGSIWTDWEDWQKSSLIISMDLDNDIITIFSKKKQKYIVYDIDDGHYDSGGDYVIEMKVFDQDSDYGKIRLMRRTSGAYELYVLFANVQWVYRIEEV